MEACWNFRSQCIWYPMGGCKTSCAKMAINTYQRGLAMSEMAAKLRRQRLIDKAVRSRKAKNWNYDDKNLYLLSDLQKAIAAEFTRLLSDPNV
jgi:hypothetical protein